MDTCYQFRMSCLNEISFQSPLAFVGDSAVPYLKGYSKKTDSKVTTSTISNEENNFQNAWFILSADPHSCFVCCPQNLLANIKYF